MVGGVRDCQGGDQEGEIYTGMNGRNVEMKGQTQEGCRI